MATDKQIEANRRNALLSTGPTSLEGKERSRLNALKHGFCGELIDVQLALSDQVIDRKAQWTEEIKPETEQAKYALDRAVIASIRIEQCEQAFDAMIVDESTKARLSWDLDRRLEAVTLVDKLSKRPLLYTTQLEATPHACSIKLDMWNSLGEALDANGAWTEVETTTVLDLLGVGHVMRSGRTVLDPRDGSDVTSHRRNLAIREIKRLQELKETVLDPLDDLHRRQAESGTTAIFSVRAALIQRYEREAYRRLRAAMREARGELKKKPQVVESDQVIDDLKPVEDADYEAWAKEEVLRRMAGMSARVADVQDRISKATTDEDFRAIEAEIKEKLRDMGGDFDVDEEEVVDKKTSGNRRQRLAEKARARRN